MAAAQAPARGWGRGDDGQVVTALVVGSVVGVLALLLIAVLPLAGAADQRSRAQTAADAAALAAVGAFGEQVKDALRSPVDFQGRRLGLLYGCGAGRRAADDYAGRNGATVTSYEHRSCGRPGRSSEVRVAVRTDDPHPQDGQSTASAVGRMGMWPECELLGHDLRDVVQQWDDALAAAGSAVTTAEQALTAAQDALAAAVARDLPPDQLQPLRDAVVTAQDALDAARAAASATLPDLPVEADCGAVHLRFLLRSADRRLHYEGVVTGDLDDALEPRLVGSSASDA